MVPGWEAMALHMLVSALLRKYILGKVTVLFCCLVFCSGLFGGHTSLAIVNDLSNYLMNYDYITVPINWMVGGQFSREMPSEGLSPQLIAALTKGHIGDEQVVIESHLASYPQAWCSR